MSTAPSSLTEQRTVWLSGNSGAGKTFTGDYLALCAHFHHIDGDALLFSTDPAERQLFARFVQAFDSWFEEQPAPRELWEPYYSLQCERVRAALRAHANVVISLTVYHREVRDFLRAQLPEHLFVLLRCSREELLRRARVRFAEYARSKSLSFPEAWEQAHGCAPGSFSDAEFESKTLHIMRGLQPLQPDEQRCVELDVSDGAPWAKLHDLLRLGPPPEVVPVEAIAAVNYDRFKQL